MTAPTKQDRALAKVGKARGALTVAVKQLAGARSDFHAAVVAARDAGCSSNEIAPVAGVTRERVTQLAPVAKAPRPRSQAQKDVPTGSRVSDPGTVPTLADHELGEGDGLSGIVSTRKRTRYGKATMFYRDGFGVVVESALRNVWLGWPDADNTIDGILTTVTVGCPDAELVRVYITGPTPAVAGGSATQAEAVREWALSEWETRPGPWSVESHYLSDPALPVLRFRNADTGQRVTIMRAASWWGETDADQAASAEAWWHLGRALDRERMFAGAGLGDTPATTGRALWLRTIPEGKGYPVASTELRELIGATSGQGRIELRPPMADRVPSFTYLDGRFMYASLCWGLPVGEATFWTGEQVDKLEAREWTRIIRGRGRWRITMTVPADWQHVGLFMAPGDGGRWRYPSTPGETFTTWADGCELWAAMLRGWDPVVHEGFTWAEGKPLDLWIRKLLDVWKAADAHRDSLPAQLAARAVRSMVLYAIGAFATKAHPVTKAAPLDQAPDVAAGTEVRRVGDRLVWEEPGRLPGWSEEVSHPEWSATIWARARVRLLDGKGVNGAAVGALHLPVEQVIAFATDALYLSSDPEWADDGAPGRFRAKGRLDVAAPWPASYVDLYALRDRAEGNA